VSSLKRVSLLPCVSIFALFAIGIYSGTSKIDAAQSKTLSRQAGTSSSVQENNDRITPATQLNKSYAVDFKEFRLKNGLRVLLAEDHSAPTYSICVTYNVGSRDERPGRTGFAHLFEHMLFQGSENVGKGEHFILVQNNGGSANGTTNIDRTNYWQPAPTDSDGRITFPALIPGATYRIEGYKDHSMFIAKEFSVESGQTQVLGEIVVEEQK